MLKKLIFIHVFLATGEPPFNLSIAAIFALRNAIDSARRDIGNYEWYQMGKLHKHFYNLTF